MKNSARAARLQAKRVIEERMGLLVSSNDIVLLEAGEHAGKLDRILFYRMGFRGLQYEAVWDGYVRTWRLTLINMNTQEETTI